MLLDIMLPLMNGRDVCKTLRAERSQVPIIMLTSKAEEADIVLGLEIGADDYITKPFRLGRACGEDQSAASSSRSAVSPLHRRATLRYRAGELPNARRAGEWRTDTYVRS